MLLLITHIAACLANFGDTAFGDLPKVPMPVVDTVRITAERIEFANVGRKETRISIDNSYGLLSQTLMNSAQFFKEYGISGSATISKRGADATQTQVLWNGLPINHPMLGMMDFNGISTFGLDEMILVEGGNSAMYGSGSVGGTLVLNNQIRYNSPLQIKFQGLSNSLRNFQTGFQLSKGWSKTYVNISSTLIDRQNRFDYFDPILQRNNPSFNSELENRNIRLVAAHNSGPHQIKIITELGKVNRGLGFVFGSNSALGKQVDFQNKHLFQYDLHLKHTHLTQKIGYTRDKLIFFDERNTGDTSIAKMLFLQTECYHITPWGRALLGFDYQVQQGQSRYYQQEQLRLLPALFGAWKGHVGKTNYLINARYEFLERVGTWGLGTQTSIFKGFAVKSDIHRSFRRPTLNDLYWEVPSRNSLVSELGWGAELGLIWSRDFKQNSTLNLELTPFYRELENPIIWLPQGAYWAAQNLYFGRYTGVQFSVNLTYTQGNSTWRFSENTEWVNSAVKANEGSEYLQQIFVPDLMSSTNIIWKYKRIDINVTWQKVGNRFTTTDNSTFMSAYQLLNIETGWKSSLWGLFQNKVAVIRMGVQNALNVSYQNMPGRPMPPRNTYVQILFKF